MFKIVVISFYLLVGLNFCNEEVVVLDFAAFTLFAVLNDDIHGLLLNSLEESSAALAHFGWLTWH